MRLQYRSKHRGDTKIVTNYDDETANDWKLLIESVNYSCYFFITPHPSSSSSPSFPPFECQIFMSFYITSPPSSSSSCPIPLSECERPKVIPNPTLPPTDNSINGESRNLKKTKTKGNWRSLLRSNLYNKHILINTY